MKLKKALKFAVFPLLLLLLVLILFITNYQPGTYFIGWDSLQTELNPLLAIKRATHASWQEYQSFGLTSGMAHASDLIRAVLLFMVSLVLPQSIIRYAFHFFMLYAGGLGLFFLLRYLGFRKDKQVLAFIGACFYILNLGTVQIFSLPFEPFSVFFGLLPWEIYVFLKFVYAKKLTPRHILALVVVNILATPQAYLQTLFLVYFMCLGFLSFGVFLESSNKKLIKRFMAAYGLIIIVNLFWILPQLYFLRTSLSVVRASKINQLATDIISNQNLEKGTLKNFARLEGFYYDLYDTSDNLIFGPWHAHFKNFFVRILSYTPFAFIILGLFRRKRSHYGLVSIFILVSLMLLSNTATLSYFNSLIFSHSFINQVFRSPFTKFVVPFSLVYSYLFVVGLEIIYNLLVKSSQGKRKLEIIIFTSVTVLLMVVYSLPAFLGNYVADIMRVKIPGAYFETIEYFKEQDKNKRIALLPDYTFWGWFSHKWSYDGSGFIWYGIEQPIVSRTFDVWSLHSESYFWEIKYAIESINTGLFEDVLEKYNIDYLILDHSLKPVASVEEGLQYDQLARILEESSKVVSVKKFEGIEILKVNHGKNIDNFISVAEKLPTVSPHIGITNLDKAYIDLGDYKTSENPAYVYPFLNLMTQTELIDQPWEISEGGDYFIVSGVLEGIDVNKYHLDENTVPLEAKVFLGKEIFDYQYEVNTSLEENRLVVQIKKEIIEGFDPTYVEVNNCRDLGDFGVLKRGSTLTIESGERGMACFGYSSSLLDHWNGYLVKVDSNNVRGKELFFYIFGNRTRKQSKVEVNLKGDEEYFILNPGYFYDDGYFFSFQNPSYETVESENKLNLLEVYLLPFDYLKNIRLVRNDLLEDLPETKYVNFFASEKTKYYAYKFSGTGVSGKELILHQAYDPGWRAYKMQDEGEFIESLPFLFGEEIEDHFVVNNWANGWKIPQLQRGEYIILFFWPQMLEYAGIIFLIVIWNVAIVGTFIRLRVHGKTEENM